MSPSGQISRILVIDDNPQELFVLNQGLSKRPELETHGLNHGDAAFEHLETSPRLPNLIILDVDMPGMSGLEFLAGLKMDSRWGDIPVILMTSGSGTDEEQGLEMGAADWVQKPVHIPSLLVRIHHQLKLSHQRQRARRIKEETEIENTKVLQHLAQNIKENIEGVQSHWDSFAQLFKSNAVACPPDMQEEVPALIHQIRDDVARMLRLAEGV